MTPENHKVFYNHINIKNFRSILALNGELPDSSFFYSNRLPIIAADGAMNTLYNMCVKPNFVIGDLDTVKSELLKDINSIYILDQSKCDFEKSLNYASQLQLLPTIVVGMSGGYMDHIINNISKFLINYGNIFYAPPLVGHVIHCEENKHFYLPKKTKLSIFGMPHAQVSSYGLKWELYKDELEFPYSNSTFNRTDIEQFNIEVHKGRALVIIYLQEINDCGNL